MWTSTIEGGSIKQVPGSVSIHNHTIYMEVLGQKMLMKNNSHDCRELIYIHQCFHCAHEEVMFFTVHFEFLWPVH